MGREVSGLARFRRGEVGLVKMELGTGERGRTDGRGQLRFRPFGYHRAQVLFNRHATPPRKFNAPSLSLSSNSAAILGAPENFRQRRIAPHQNIRYTRQRSEVSGAGTAAPALGELGARWPAPSFLTSLLRTDRPPDTWLRGASGRGGRNSQGQGASPFVMPRTRSEKSH